MTGGLLPGDEIASLTYRKMPLWRFGKAWEATTAVPER